MESIPYIFPKEPPESQYLPLKTTKIKCEIDFQIFNKDDHESLLDVLKMDYQNMIKELINSNGMPDRWLDMRLPNNTDKNEYVIYNILIKNGFKKIKSSEKHLIYGHHFLLVFALQENDIKLNYKQIKERLEAFVKTVSFF
uniref:Uncharacterized protein n=1 Tax=Panagrolaimus sp. PS1159 TaxID=55785 RepID=A0AC35FXY1_9BILA